MAKLTVTVDTEAKTFEVAVDGQAVPDPCCVRVDTMGYDDPEPHFEVVSGGHDGSVMRRTHTSAAPSGPTPSEAARAIAAMWEGRRRRPSV